MKTLKKVLALRQKENDAFAARCNARESEANRIHNIMRAHPQIGALCRNGKSVFYVYPAGGVYKESCNIDDLVTCEVPE